MIGTLSQSVFLIILPNYGLSDGEDSDDEDETAELLRELEKIKRERAEEAAKKVIRAESISPRL